MRVNVDRVLERDQKLTELDSRAGIHHCSLSVCLYVVTHTSSFFFFFFSPVPRTFFIVGPVHSP